MLVLSRQLGEAIRIGSDEWCSYVITVASIDPDKNASEITVDSFDLAKWERLATTLRPEKELSLDHGVKLCMVEVRGDKVRIGITAPRELSVHRLEVYEAILRENMGGDGGPDTGPSGSPALLPKLPGPPSLDVRLREPPPPDERRL